MALFSSSESQRLQSFLDSFDRDGGPRASTSAPAPLPSAYQPPLAPNSLPALPPSPYIASSSDGVNAMLGARLAGVSELDDDKRRAQTEALTGWLANKGFSPAPAPLMRAPSQPVPPSPRLPMPYSQSTASPYGLVTPTQSQFSSPVSPARPTFAAPPSMPIIKSEPEDPQAKLAAAAPKLKAPPKKRKAAKAKKDDDESEAGPSRNANGLLTEEQKRANHIASEQKRRMAIRQGYDALCEVVPALKAAVQEFEDRLALSRKGRGIEDDEEIDVKGKRKRANADETTFARGSGALAGGINVGEEKIDGRAGPKSEAVVLNKSVEYLKQTKQRRAELLAQLAQVQALAAQRGIAIPPAPQPWLDAAPDTTS